MSDEDDFYVLSAEGHHDQDVKGIAAMPAGTGGVVTASRDTSISTWYQKPVAEDCSHEQLTQALSFNGHQGFTNDVAYHPGVKFLDGEACLVSGSNDTHIILWSLDSGMMLAILDGHTKPVKSLCVLENGDIVSASWDSTCCVWSGVDGQRKFTFKGHKNSVTQVTPVPGTNTVLSSSGDRSIIHWDASTGAILRTFNQGLKDSVQCVAAYDATSFLSGGNDCTITRWNLNTGDKMQVLEGHSAFIYSIAVHPETKEIVSASEDRSVKVWRNFNCVQSLGHPRLVWSVRYTNDTPRNLATGSEDGFVRIWTTNVSAMASPAVVDRLEQLISANAPKPQEVAKATANALESEEVLKRLVGNHEGEKRMVRNGNDVDVYVWSNGGWAKVGTVVAEPGGGGGGDTITTGGGGGGGGGRPTTRGPKVSYQGKMWDYVFDVDMNGSPARMGYNAGGSVYDAAQIFVFENAHLGVAQDDKELLIQHICNNITEEDLALIGGASGTSKFSSGGGNGEGAFSEFAKEAEAMKRQGVAETKSWGQRMKEMKAEDADVAFSTYAQEGRDIAAGGGASSQSGPAMPDSVSALAIKAPEVFSGLSNAPVIAKVCEFLPQGTSSEGDVASAVQHVTAFAVEGNTSLGATLPIDQIQSWIAAIGAGHRTPALDVLRCALSRANDFTIDPAVVANVATLLVTGALEGDNEKIVALRLLANAAQSPTLFEAIIVVPGLFEGLRVHVGHNPTKAPLRAASIALFKNLTMQLGNKKEDDALSEASTMLPEDLVAAAANWLIFTTDTKEKVSLLSLAITLHHSENQVVQAMTTDAGGRLLIAAVKSMKNFGDQVVMMASRDLYTRYNTTE